MNSPNHNDTALLTRSGGFWFPDRHGGTSIELQEAGRRRQAVTSEDATGKTQEVDKSAGQERPFGGPAQPVTPEEASTNTVVGLVFSFLVSRNRRCYSDDPLTVPLDGLHVDDKLQFVEEPVEIMDREVKQLRRSCVPIVKVRWNSKRGPEFTWEHEDQFKKKYSHLFRKTAPSSSTAS
ncbi:hypothetical protein Tco_0657046 [Tanacetum coccineum]|uniref:Reverse transcriptase domain-containing protein n=1 Tax=Tanacetum coccineum TaxID=301880 RepID=A0ABQ4XBS9_9ASTR